MESGGSSRELAVPRERALEAVGSTAEDWGGRFERQGTGGLLELPVLAGLRHGWVRVALTTESLTGDRTRLLLAPPEEHLTLHRPALAVLLLAALGAAPVVAWPFFPALLHLAPLGAVLAVAGWLLVGTRIRHRGLGEFQEEVVAWALDPGARRDEAAP